MKKSYTTPKLTVHGTVDEMTKVLGPAAATDMLQIGGNVIPNTTGSQDFTSP